MLHVVRPDKTPNKPAEEPAPTPAAPAAPAAAAAAGGKKVAGKAGGKKAAAKPITEAMTEDIIPALKTALGKEDGVSSLELTFADNTVSARRGSAPVQALQQDGLLPASPALWGGCCSTGHLFSCMLSTWHMGLSLVGY